MFLDRIWDYTKLCAVKDYLITFAGKINYLARLIFSSASDGKFWRYVSPTYIMQNKVRPNFAYNYKVMFVRGHSYGDGTVKALL